jgi:AraC family transcriptional regulator
MILDLAQWRDSARAGATSSAGASTFLARGLTGGGDFRFESVSIGIMLSPLASHRAAYASDRHVALPLAAGEGWVFPAGAEGHCDWAGGNDFLSVELADDRFEANGLKFAHVGRLGAGMLDPLTVTLALQLHAAGEASSLYRDTLSGALASHLSHLSGQPGLMAPSALDDARLKRARDLIDARIGENLSLETLANVAGMSPFHFARAFKAATGLAPHQYLLTRRIERAKHMLDTTALTIADIGLHLGWEHAGKFGARFKAQTGVTPGGWRAR